MKEKVHMICTYSPEGRVFLGEGLRCYEKVSHAVLYYCCSDSFFRSGGLGGYARRTPGELWLDCHVCSFAAVFFLNRELGYVAMDCMNLLRRINFATPVAWLPAPLPLCRTLRCRILTWCNTEKRRFFKNRAKHGRQAAH